MNALVSTIEAAGLDRTDQNGAGPATQSDDSFHDCFI